MAKSTRIRMYNVGLGDCFLLTFPAPGRDRHVLIDCGTHPSGPGPRPARAVAETIVEDVRGADGVPRIDVVVATHRHGDHVSGFDSPAWSEVVVSEVWMPWTEDPDDPEARAILVRQATKAKKLHAALRMAAAPAEHIEIVENSLTNADAMRTLHHGFAGSPRRRFLPNVRRPRETLRTAVLPGVKVHVLGPSRDPEIVRDMTPPKGETYLRLTDGSLTEGYEPPFRDRWRVPPSDVEFATWWGGAITRGAVELNASPAAARTSVPAWIASLGLGTRLLRRIDEAAADDAFALLVAIDKAVNGTSLMLMFETERSCLLFPGDAQWGTWQRAMDDEKSRKLLERTTFLKVGHHGSHNATPVDFVEEVLPDDFIGMVCTRETKKFPEIPREPLLRRLRKKGQVVRSDGRKDPDGFTRQGKVYVETSVPW